MEVSKIDPQTLSLLEAQTKANILNFWLPELCDYAMGRGKVPGGRFRLRLRESGVLKGLLGAPNPRQGRLIFTPEFDMVLRKELEAKGVKVPDVLPYKVKFERPKIVKSPKPPKPTAEDRFKSLMLIPQYAEFVNKYRRILVNIHEEGYNFVDCAIPTNDRFGLKFLGVFYHRGLSVGAIKWLGLRPKPSNCVVKTVE